MCIAIVSYTCTYTCVRKWSVERRSSYSNYMITRWSARMPQPTTNRRLFKQRYENLLRHPPLALRTTVAIVRLLESTVSSYSSTYLQKKLQSVAILVGIECDSVATARTPSFVGDNLGSINCCGQVHFLLSSVRLVISFFHSLCSWNSKKSHTRMYRCREPSMS